MIKLLFFCLLINYGTTKEDFWEDLSSIPKININPQKGKPIQLSETATKIQLNLNGTLYSDSLSQLTQVSDLRLSFDQVDKIQPGAFCSGLNLKKLTVIIRVKHEPPTLTKLMFKNCQNLKELSILGGVGNPPKVQTDTLQGLTDLENLNLIEILLKQVSQNYFKNLKSLLYLTLKNCAIEKIDSDAFYDLKNLKELEIYYNSKLVRLPQKLFKKASKLERLLLVNNNITDLTWDEFEGLLSLKYLQIGRNRISSFNAEKMARNLPNLREFGFELNPLECRKREEFANELRSKLNHSINIDHKFDPGYYDSCEEY